MNVIQENIKPYLSSKEFSNSMSLYLTDKNKKLCGRENILLDIVKNNKIIHLGCTDHLELIDKKIKGGNWLHGNLSKASKKNIGLDINKQAIEYLKNKYNIKNIYHYNVFSDDLPQEIQNENFEYIILGEILEHVDNPVDFLKLINLKFGKIVSKIIITVPNSLSLLNIKMALKNIEFINSDHRYWFTPYTLSKICNQANIESENYTFYISEKYSLLFRFLLKRNNLFQDGIVWIGKLNNI